jgi:argininosuccinate lyase
MKLWGGRFEKPAAEHFEEFSRSLHFDRRLLFADIEGTVAWVHALARIGIFSAGEAEQVVAALEAVAAEARANADFFKDAADEDVHTLVLRQVNERIGPELAGRVHTGRSRNEQVAVDLRIWMKAEIRALLAELDALLAALVAQAERWPDAVLPGYTHLRRAQPVLWAHYLLAYFEMLARDRARLERCHESADVMPLGSGALAGSGLPIDREAIARELGFATISANSLDATSDRDFALEFLFAAACVFLHLSRLAEDWILYSGEEFGFLEMADEVSSGSSLMPQKKNPDSLELIRGKTGRVYGNLLALLTTMKGVALSYHRDLQEDKEPVFDSAGQLRGALRMAALVVATVTPKPGTMEAAAAGGWSCATDLAEYLALRGVPFNQAHQTVGRIVLAGVSSGRPPEGWTLAELREYHPAFAEDALPLLQGAHGIARRELPGGTGPKAVAAALAEAKRRLAQWQSAAPGT